MKAARPTKAKKHPYRTPRLVVHGDLKMITQAKRGIRADGGQKPRTKLLGGNA
jgi:hypothetical protein